MKKSKKHKHLWKYMTQTKNQELREIHDKYFTDAGWIAYSEKEGYGSGEGYTQSDWHDVGVEKLLEMFDKQREEWYNLGYHDCLYGDKKRNITKEQS